MHMHYIPIDVEVIMPSNSNTEQSNEMAFLKGKQKISIHKLKQAIRSNEHVQLRHSNHADQNPPQ